MLREWMIICLRPDLAVAVELALRPWVKRHAAPLHRTALIRAQISSCPEWDKCVTEYPFGELTA